MSDENPLLGLIQAVPSAQVGVTWVIDAVVVSIDDDGRERSEPRIILSISTPLGILKFWFHPNDFRGLCVQGLEITKQVDAKFKAASSRIEVARGVPPQGAEQISQQAAEEILRKLANGGKP